MKIISHPDLYRQYKDKKIAYYALEGIVVGYFINYNKELIMIAEMKKKNIPENNIMNIIKNHNYILKDYHGNPSKCFFLVSQSSFDKNIAHEIEF